MHNSDGLYWELPKSFACHQRIDFQMHRGDSTLNWPPAAAMGREDGKQEMKWGMAWKSMATSLSRRCIRFRIVFASVVTTADICN